MKHLASLLLSAAACGALLPAGHAAAAEYVLDPGHSFVEFRIQHLGFSWLYGRFNVVDGRFSYDPDAPEASRVSVVVDTTSIDTNHAERDKHLRSEEFLAVDAFPRARFESTGYEGDAEAGVLTGVLNFHGVERSIEIPVQKVGEGPDPWGGYRAGFHGTYVMTRKDFGLDYDLGPSATTVTLELGIEGVRQ